MKKIIVFYGTYGGGHIAAAKSISNHIFNNNPEIDIEAIDCIEYVNKYLNRITTDAYKGATKKTPSVWKYVYEKSNQGALAKITTASNKLMASKLKKLILDKKPDLIISTHPFSSQMCAYLKKKKIINCELATVMTDFHVHNQWLYLPEYVNYFFVANNLMKDQMINNDNIPEEKIYVTGIPISDKFKKNYDRQDICEEFWLEPEKKIILFFGGGEFGLGREMSYMTLKTLIRLFKDIQIIAISGKNKKMYNSFNDLVMKTNSADRVKVLEYTDKVAELMSIANIVVTKAGGLTIAESLASSLPIIIINPIPGQEEENAEFLVTSGCAIWIKNNDNIARALKTLSRDQEKLSQMREASTKLAKPDATEDICNILINNLDN